MLTPKKIAALLPQDKRYVVSDGLGLTIRIYPSGKKSFVLRLSENGRVSDITLGHWPELSLKAARQKSRQIRKRSGLELQRGFVFNDAFRLWKNLKRGHIVSYMDEKRRLERYIIPYLGNRQLDEITAPLVIHTVQSLDKTNKRATLKRVLMRTREILDLAVCAGYIQHNPINRVSRVFAPPSVISMPSIDWRELSDVMTIMRNAPRKIQVLFLWSLCSALRPGENACLEWSWIDGDTLIIPESAMKKSRIHRVPLTKLMQNILLEAKHLSIRNSPFVFSSSRHRNKSISSQALTKYLRSSKLSGQLVAHGLRSMFRCWAADNEIAFEPAEAVLSHVTGSSVSRAYQRSDYFSIRKSIMTKWCSYISDCAQSAGFLTDLLD